MKRNLSSQIHASDIANKIAALSPEKRSLLELRFKEQVSDGHTLIAQTLKRLGITNVYGMSGTPIDETLAACAENDIRPIGVRHQQAGVMMALAQNYVTGRLAAISIVSAGPAVTNAVTGVLIAKDNCWPLIVIGGRRSLNMQGMGSFQDLDAVPIYQSITKWTATVRTVESIPELLVRAYEIATSGRPGPVYLDIPEDVLVAKISIEKNLTTFSSTQTPPSADSASIAQVVDILLKAKRPALIIGKGARWSAPFNELREFVENFNIPFITSPMGKGYLPDGHPLCFNDASSLLQSNADVVLLLGVRLDWTFRFGAELSSDVKLIHVDIHADEIGRNVKPAIGIVGDIKQVLQEILMQLNNIQERENNDAVKSWNKQLENARKDRKHKLELQTRNDAIPMSPQRMIKEIRDSIPQDAIIVLDGNVIMAAAQQILPSYFPVSLLTAGSNGCIGAGIPFGIGAKLGNPECPVFVICGDTGIGFSAMEMETAIRHRIPITVIIANNDGNMGGLKQKAYYPKDYPERVTMYQPGIHYERIMEIFGGHAEYVEHPKDLKPALERSMASGIAACINVKVDPYAAYPGK